MRTDKPSICFNCKNAFAHKCIKIFNGTPIKDWKILKKDDGGIVVVECPKYIPIEISLEEYLKIIKVSMNQFIKNRGRYINKANKTGYSVICTIVNKEKRYSFYNITDREPLSTLQHLDAFSRKQINELRSWDEDKK